MKNLPRPFGRYILEQRIAMGGMAEIYRARVNTEGFQKRVCIKRILPHFLENEEFVAMFRDEAALAARLQHGNVVQVFDFGEEEESLYLAMEFVDGADLKKLLVVARDNREKLKIGQALQIGIEICRGLHHAHTLEDENGTPLGIVHRDISPHNILISRAGEVKVTDFGIAKAAERATHTAVGIVKGKLAYMAPEQAEGVILDHRVDQFASAILLWETITNERLFGGGNEAKVLRNLLVNEIKPPSAFRADVPPEVDEVVLKALSRDRDKRYKDMRAFERALTKCQFAVADDPGACDIRQPIRNLLELSAPMPRRTAVLQKAPIEQSEVMSLTEAGFEELAEESSVFTSSGENPPANAAVIALTQAVDPAARTELIDGSASNPIAPAPEQSTGVTRTVAAAEKEAAALLAAATAKQLPLTTTDDHPAIELTHVEEEAASDPVAPAVPTELIVAEKNRKPLYFAAAAGLVAVLLLAFVLSRNQDDVAPSEVATSQTVLSVDPAKVEAVKAEAGKVEAVKAEAVKAEPVKAEAVKAEAVKAEPVKAEAIKAEPVKAEPVKVAPTAKAAKTEPVKIRPVARKEKSKKKASKKADGSVYVDVIGSWAKVYVAGKLRCAETPCRFAIASGKHRLRLVLPTGKKSRSISVKPNKQTRVIVKN